ncbi:ATP-dependent translocase ABCB1 [Periplaneta americana]|uniref:ATP-dependent translocase ABCB1 n=1 Tax=Periplaneta americana TaxID=6978 RepID=UPI0037E96396
MPRNKLEINGSSPKKDPLDTEFTEPPDKDKDKEKEEKKDDPKPIGFFKLYRFATGMEKFLLFLGCLGAVATGATAPLNMLWFGDLTGKFVYYQLSLYSNGTENFGPDYILDAVELFAIQNSLLGLAMLVFTYVSIWAFNYVSSRQIYRIRDLYLRSALSQDIAWYDVQQTGEFASRMSEDLTKLEDGIGEKVIQFLHFQFSAVGSLILAFIKGWLLALVCLSSFPVTMISVGLVGMVSTRLSKKELVAYGKAGAIAEQALSSIRTVVAFGGQEMEVERYKKNLVYAKAVNVKRGFFSGLGFGLLWFFIYASYALAFWYGIGLVLEDRYKPEEEQVYKPDVMVTVFFGVMMGSMNFGMSSPYIEAFSIARGAGAKVYSVIDRISPINSWSNDGKRPKEMNGNISFRNVHFEYPTRPDVKILQGLNLDINRGEKVAIVGSSGCGKSTCIQLIQRFYDTREGQVLMDGNDVKELNVAWLRMHIGVVGQEPVLFNTTIAENIRYGLEGATQVDIEAAAMEANAHDFISKLPQGYNTLVGERGAQLSGGQKQRIAIARALVRKPAILLLDEATSALDTTSEAKVQRALDKASKGRTTVIVAHRLSTIRTADKIVALSEGKVVEMGTHDQLMELEGHYHKLVTAQQLNVVDDKDEFVDESRKLSRLVSVESRTSSISGQHQHVDDSAILQDDSISEPPPVSMFTIIKKNQPEWPYILIGSVSSLVMGCAMPVFAFLFSDIIEAMSLPTDQQVRDETDEYSLYFVIAGIAVGFSTFLQIWTFGIAGEKLTMRLRGELFEAMVKQEIAWFDDKANSSGALCARLSGDASSIQGATGQRIGTVLQSIATIAFGVGLAMSTQWDLGLIALAFCPIILIAHFLFHRAITGESFSNKKAMEKATKLAVEAIGNIRTVASLGREQTFHQQYLAELLPAHLVMTRNTHFRGVVFGLARSIMFFAYATTMYYGGQKVANDEMAFADVLQVAQALIMGTVSIANAMAFAPNFQKGIIAAGNIFHLLNRKPRIFDPAGVSDGKWVAEGKVNYKDVEFFYPTRPNIRVLRGLNAQVLTGKTVALVGHSGCGKSTCIQLLERFYDPVGGSVDLDDRDISSMTLRLLRSQMGIVSQEPVLFDRSIAENIAYGDTSRTVPMSEIIEAAKHANIHNFVSSLPLGYETRMGEKGTQLSGGQKQRVAIARALIRNPRVLLLDEATSALDTESEKVVQEALDKAREGRTCITIAHRLSTIQDADVILVINHGQVAEMGTHSELLSKRGHYYKLCSMQNGQR